MSHELISFKSCFSAVMILLFSFQIFSSSQILASGEFLFKRINGGRRLSQSEELLIKWQPERCQHFCMEFPQSSQGCAWWRHVGSGCDVSSTQGTWDTQQTRSNCAFGQEGGKQWWSSCPGREQGRYLNFPKQNREEGCEFVQENSRYLVWGSPAEVQTTAAPRERDVPAGLWATKLTVV